MFLNNVAGSCWGWASMGLNGGRGCRPGTGDSAAGAYGPSYSPRWLRICLPYVEVPTQI